MKNQHRKFVNTAVRFGLSSPLSCHRNTPAQRMPFESRIVRLLIDRNGGDVDGAIARMHSLIDHWSPLEGVYIAKASQCVLEYPVLQGSDVSFIKDIFRYVSAHDERSRVIDVNWNNKVDTIRRGYKFTPNLYQTFNVKHVWFFLRCEIDAIREIVESGSKKFGPLRAKGGAEIEYIDVQEVPTNNELFGVISHDKLLRPVPARIEGVLRDRPSGNSLEYLRGGMENWHIPYYEEGNKEPCLVPVQAGKHMTLSLSEIQELVV